MLDINASQPRGNVATTESAEVPQVNLIAIPSGEHEGMLVLRKNSPEETHEVALKSRPEKQRAGAPPSKDTSKQPDETASNLEQNTEAPSEQHPDEAVNTTDSHGKPVETATDLPVVTRTEPAEEHPDGPIVNNEVPEQRTQVSSTVSTKAAQEPSERQEQDQDQHQHQQQMAPSMSVESPEGSEYFGGEFGLSADWRTAVVSPGSGEGIRGNRCLSEENQEVVRHVLARRDTVHPTEKVRNGDVAFG